MKSSDIKKNKNDEELYEEVGDEVFGTDTFQPAIVVFINKFMDKYNEFKQTKMFLPVVFTSIFLIFVIIVILAFSGGDSKTLISDIRIKTPKIIYLEEQVNFNVEVYGKGELENTNLKFSISNERNAELKDKELTGSSVSNMITAKNLGTFYINVKYKNGKQKNEIKSERIAVCEKLTTDMFNEIIVNKNQAKRIRFNTESPDVCYENIKYTIEDTSIAAMSTEDQILGIKKGVTKLIVTSGTQKIELTVRVDD